MNLWQSQSIIQQYQNMYPDVLMLRDSGSVWNQYRKNGYIPLNYVIGHELNQLVDYSMEGYNHTIITNRLKALVSDVSVNLTSGQTSYQIGTPLDLNMEFKNWSTVTQDCYAIIQVGYANKYYSLFPLTHLVVAPSSSENIPITSTVPLSTPPETYTLRVILGVTGDLWYIEKMDVTITL